MTKYDVIENSKGEFELRGSRRKQCSDRSSDETSDITYPSLRLSRRNLWSVGGRAMRRDRVVVCWGSSKFRCEGAGGGEGVQIG